MAKKNPTGAASLTTVTLAPEQVAYLRTLLFEDLHERADALADVAHEAHETDSRVAGLDAQGAYRNGLGPIANLLDLFGWDTDGDLPLLKRWEKSFHEARR